MSETDSANTANTSPVNDRAVRSRARFRPRELISCRGAADSPMKAALIAAENSRLPCLIFRRGTAKPAPVPDFPRDIKGRGTAPTEVEGPDGRCPRQGNRGRRGRGRRGVVVGDRSHRRRSRADRVASACRNGQGNGFIGLDVGIRRGIDRHGRRRGAGHYLVAGGTPRFRPLSSHTNLRCNTPAANIYDEGNVAAIKRSHQCGCPFPQLEVALIRVERDDTIELYHLPVFSLEGFLRKYQ